MKARFYFFAALIEGIIFISCSSDNVKESINKAGDVTGQAVGEFASGVSNGVEKAVEPQIVLSENLKNKGISFGKMTVASDTAGTDNLLTVYVIFNQDFAGTFSAKAFDAKGAEMGRLKEEVSGKKDDARYVEFHFDKHTNIDNDSKITLE
jgi:hypothetical protein